MNANRSSVLVLFVLVSLTAGVASVANGQENGSSPVDLNASSSTTSTTDGPHINVNGLFVVSRPADKLNDAAALFQSAAPEQPQQPGTTPLPKGPEPTPPTPPSTGFRALAPTVGRDFLSFPRRPSTWVILGIGAGAALLGHPADDQANSHIVSSPTVGKLFAPGKWLGAAWFQGGASVGTYLVGRYLLPPIEGEPRTNKVSHIGYDLLRAQLLSQGLIHSVKYAVRRDRPTGECCSFPSGHAASAFAAASVLERHLGYRAAWPTLVAASYVAVSRLHDNRHFLSDILFGSAIGMATGWTVVGRRGNEEPQFTLMPVPVHGGFAIAVMRVAPSS